MGFPIQGSVGKSVKTSEIEDSAVTSSKLASDSVTSSKVKDSAISTSKLASGSVNSGKIASRSIAAGKVQTGTLTANEIGSKVIGTTEISTSAITDNEVSTGTFDRITGIGTQSQDVDFEGGIILKNKLSRIFRYDALSDNVDPFTFTDQADTNADSADNGVTDGVNGGREIQTGTADESESGLDLGNKRHFDPSNCIIYGIAKRDDAQSYVWCGVSDDQNEETDDSVGYVDDAQVSFKFLQVYNNGSGNNVNTDVAVDTAVTKFKIVCGASDQKLYLLVGGVWTLKATQSTKLPTDPCQPIFLVHTKTATAVTGKLISLVVIDDS